MFSAKKRPFSKEAGPGLWGKGKGLLSSKPWSDIRPRVSMRVWLTALFVLVTAVAAVTAYEIVRPIMERSLNEASKTSFREVGNQFEDQLRQLERRGEDLSLQRIRSFAATRGLQWGIVRAERNEIVEGNLEDFWPGVVEEAISEREPREKIAPVPSGAHVGQRQATYAYPIQVEIEGKTETQAVVFNKFFTRSEIENVEAALDNIERLAILAGILALLIAGFAGYFAAVLISRRVSRLGVAAERLAAGNFDERINTRVEDEVGSLGATFNAMAVSLNGAFDQIKQEKERGSAILDGMTDAVVGVDKDLNAVFLNPQARKLLESSDRAFHNR
ncbi:MAG TPA: HAMP domain-containing protein, partial [Rubrobacter sp.]|nr:HAMP domain-containing protein [Rubrobacter sp.]